VCSNHISSVEVRLTEHVCECAFPSVSVVAPASDECDSAVSCIDSSISAAKVLLSCVSSAATAAQPGGSLRAHGLQIHLIGKEIITKR
jgi:hypothetical protein